jgi:hypothetical protein
MVLDLYNALVWVCDAEVDYGVDAGKDVIAGYNVLGRDVHGQGSKVYLDHPVHERPQQEEPWSFGTSLDLTETEDHTPLVFLDDLDGADYDRRQENARHERGRPVLDLPLASRRPVELPREASSPRRSLL